MVENHVTRVELAGALQNKSILLNDLGRHEEALAAIVESSRIWLEDVEVDETNREHHARAQMVLARNFIVQGEYIEAKRAVRLAFDQYRILAEHDGLSGQPLTEYLIWIAEEFLQLAAVDEDFASSDELRSALTEILVIDPGNAKVIGYLLDIYVDQIDAALGAGDAVRARQFLEQAQDRVDHLDRGLVDQTQRVQLLELERLWRTAKSE